VRISGCPLFGQSALLAVIFKRMMDMLSKNQIINGMCLTYRHDYGMLPAEQQQEIKNQMEQLYTHNFYPVLEDIHDDACCACPQCMAVVAINIKSAMGR
jgi:hypothetical protein